MTKLFFKTNSQVLVNLIPVLALLYLLGKQSLSLTCEGLLFLELYLLKYSNIAFLLLKSIKFSISKFTTYFRCFVVFNIKKILRFVSNNLKPRPCHYDPTWISVRIRLTILSYLLFLLGTCLFPVINIWSNSSNQLLLLHKAL